MVNRDKEQEFADLIGARLSSQDEDLGGVDVKADFTVDVKAMKKVWRGDNSPQGEFHWIELRNVQGNPGWAYSKADFIAFETPGSWLLVKPSDLQGYLKTVQFMLYDGEDIPLFKLYSRKGRKDLMTLIPTDKLKTICFEILKKSD